MCSLKAFNVINLMFPESDKLCNISQADNSWFAFEKSRNEMF